MQEYILNSLYINPTVYCNLRCCHCWLNPPYKSTYDAIKNELTVDELIAIVKAAIPLGLSSVKLTGGEPLLRDDLSGLLSFCKDYKITVFIETNGTLIDDCRARQLKEQDVSFVSVSLDGGTSHIHDSFRGVQGSFELAIKGIKHLIAAGFAPQVITCLHRDNVNSWDSLLDLLNELGVKNLKVNVVNYIGRAETTKYKNQYLSVQEVLAFSQTIPLIKQRFPHKIFLDIPPVFKKLEELDKAAVCGILGILGIMPGGEVSICGIGLHVEELIFGRLKGLSSEMMAERLRDIWLNNNVLQLLRRDVPGQLEGVCGRCVLKYRCFGKCRADTYYHHRNFREPDWFCALAYDQGLFPHNRLVPDTFRTNLKPDRQRALSQERIKI